MRPSVGEIMILGQKPWGNTALMEQFGFCPDYDNLSDEQTPRTFLQFVGGLHGMSGNELNKRVEEVIKVVGSPVPWSISQSCYCLMNPLAEQIP